MKKENQAKIKILLRLIIIVMFLTVSNVYGQSDTQRVIPPPRSVQLNAGFDVIVKLNGDIVYGLVKEVGPYFISYQRTDIPDGPIYTIPRNEVYVISYRNQVKDYITPMESGAPIDSHYPHRQIDYKKDTVLLKKDTDLFKNGSISFGLGFIRGFTKVMDVKNYSSSATFPVISFGYEINYKSNLNLGVKIGFGSHKFATQQFSSYDSTQNNISLKENIFALYVYGRYFLSQSTSKLQPYILGGLGITTSNILSNNTISFTNDNSQVILVKSGTRSAPIGITARIGGYYFINKQLKFYLDAGLGLSVINVGLTFSLKQF